MSLSIEATLRGVADVLRDRVSPTLDDSYAIEATRLSTMMMTIMANAADDAAALRVAENAHWRALFLEATAPTLTILADPALAARLREAAASADPGLRISQLDAETDRLRRLAVALQVQLEARADPAAVAFNQRIWQHLRAIEKDRAPRL